MRVLLVQAFTALDMELVYPIGLAYLAAHLEDIDVRIFDINLHRDRPYEALERALRQFEPEVVGLSLRNIKVATPGTHTDDFAPQQATVKFIREVLPDAFLVIGGTAFSLYAEAFMERLPEVDAGVWGEAEHRFAKLLATRRPDEIPGVYYRQHGEVKYTGPPTDFPFDSLKHPRRDLVDHAPYAASSFVSVGVQSKRGCALHCIHCSDTFLAGNTVRTRPATDVVDEIEDLVENHKVTQLFFCDQIFNIPPEHAIEICKEIVRRDLDIQWSAWFNENKNTLPDELMIWLKRAGCGILSFSPDHVDNRMLKTLHKNFRYDDMVYTYQVAKRFGFDVEYSFFLNSPGEDWRSIMAIFRFLAKAKLHLGPQLRMFTLLMMQPIRIYPHTRLAALARETGLIGPDDDLIQARFWNPGSLSFAVAGIQASAQLAFRLRQKVRSIRRVGPPTVMR
jgi:putative variant cofactor biosynthesis B12-binding/radical SAM domain protein 1